MSAPSRFFQGFGGPDRRILDGCRQGYPSHNPTQNFLFGLIFSFLMLLGRFLDGLFSIGKGRDFGGGETAH